MTPSADIYPIGSKMHLTLASSLVTIVGLLTSCLAYIFDWNESILLSFSDNSLDCRVIIATMPTLLKLTEP
jgi:hypothetical protein